MFRTAEDQRWLLRDPWTANGHADVEVIDYH
jgi:hypothetical protein